MSDAIIKRLGNLLSVKSLVTLTLTAVFAVMALVRAFIRPFPKKEDIMTGKEIYDALNDYLSKQPVPSWAKKELEEAVRMGITDGSSPMQLIPRYQAVILAKRAAEKK